MAKAKSNEINEDNIVEEPVVQSDDVPVEETTTSTPVVQDDEPSADEPADDDVVEIDYSVSVNESVQEIAYKFGTTLEAITEANPDVFNEFGYVPVETVIKVTPGTNTPITNWREIEAR